jgi:hypothetical protein
MSLNLCSFNLPNAGVPQCDKNMGIPRYMIVGDYQFTTANFASIVAWKAAFAAQCLVGRNTSGKLIVLPIIANVENTTGDNLSGTLNQGFTEILREGFPSFNFGVQISNNHIQKFRALNNSDIKVFIVDNALNVWGVVTSAGKFQGFSSRIFAGGDNFTDGQSSKIQVFNWSSTDAEEFKSSSRYFSIDFSVADYGKLKDVDLTQAIASVANVHNITGKLRTGKIGYLLDVYADFSTALANVARWTCINNQTGAAHTITSVVVNAGGYWVVTLDSTMWTALASGESVSLNWAAPSVIDPVGATGVEGVAIVLTKP